MKDQRLNEFVQKLDQLKHEYDLFLTGQRRTEPLKLRSELEREVLLLTRFPSSSTAFKFQVKTLAMRYRSFETQIKNLLELKAQRAQANEKTAPEPSFRDVVVDALAIDNPALIAASVKSFLKQVGSVSNLPADMTPETLATIMVNKAKAMVGKDNVAAIRYCLVPSDHGPKVKGEIIPKAADKSA